MNLVFVGATKFGLRCLDLVNSLPDCEVIGVVTAPETFSISYRPQGVKNVLYENFGNYCVQYGLNYRIKESRNHEALVEFVRHLNPDAFIVVGWYHMIPKSWREIAPVYGMHASLLPNYSGGAPLVWAMINGEEKTGITLFQMDSGVDSGPIVDQAEEKIYGTDTIKTLYKRIEERGLQLLKKNLPLISANKVNLKEQKATNRKIWPQRSPEDGQIDWNEDAIVIDRFVRAQTEPYPGAFSWLEQSKLVIWESAYFGYRKNDIVGLIKEIDGKFFVSCGHGLLHLQKVQFEGKKLKEYQIGNLLRKGQQLSN